MRRPGAMGRRLILLVASALALSACGSPSTPPSSTPLTLRGTPALSISVALTTAGCALDGVCVAAGASTSGVGPGAVAQFATKKGRWYPVATPSVTSANLTSSTCSTSTCLIGGASTSGDLLWLFNAPSHALSTTAVPLGGVGILGLDCIDSLDCVALDTGTNDTTRLSLSADGATSWTNPVEVPLAPGAHATSLACTSLFSCVVAQATSQESSVIVTHDGGATWTTHRVSGAASLTLARCLARRCLALSPGPHAALFESSSSTRSFARRALHTAGDAVSCSSMTICVVAGGPTTTSGSLVIWRASSTRTAHLEYVPSPLTAVSCAAQRCLAVGATTVVWFSLAP